MGQGKVCLRHGHSRDSWSSRVYISYNANTKKRAKQLKYKKRVHVYWDGVCMRCQLLRVFEGVAVWIRAYG